jgi:hypothetical protein
MLECRRASIDKNSYTHKPFLSVHLKRWDALDHYWSRPAEADLARPGKEYLMPLTLLLSRKALNNIDDIAGRWQFEGGSATESKKPVANYASFKRVTFQGTDQDGQNTASVTTTLFFIGSHPPESTTLEGAHDFNSGNETASVSAASSNHASHIGKQYTRNGATNVLHIGYLACGTHIP